MLANVTAIDNDRNDVIAEGLRIPFDYHAAWAPDAPGLKTIDDAINLRRRILLAASAAVSSRPLFISAL
jgi:NADH dehydrogenase